MRWHFWMVVLLGMNLVPWRAGAMEELLWWQIDSKNTIEFDFAVLHYTSGWCDDENAGTIDEQLGAGSLTDSGFFLITDEQKTALTVDNYAGYNFFIELVQVEGESLRRVGVTNTASYSDLVAAGHIILSGLPIPENHYAWTPTTYVPEPSSGLLLLIGVPLLALRRKRNA